jgi:hypothetical protein
LAYWDKKKERKKGYLNLIVLGQLETYTLVFIPREGEPSIDLLKELLLLFSSLSNKN